MRLSAFILFFLLAPALVWAGKPFYITDDGKEKVGPETDGDGGDDGVEKTDGALDLSLPLGLPLSYEKPTPSSADNNYMGGVSEPANKKIIYQYDIRNDIGPPSWREAQAAMRQARNMKADVILIHINGYNSAYESANTIRRSLLEYDMPVMVYVDKPAGSSGKLSCDSIYMNPKARMYGVNHRNKSGKPAPSSTYKDYMQSLMHHPAEKHTRTATNAKTTGAKQSANETRLFTDAQIPEFNFSDGNSASVDDALRSSRYDKYTIIRYTPGVYERFISLLLSSWFSLLMLCAMAFAMIRNAIQFRGMAGFAGISLWAAPFFLAGFEENLVGVSEIITFVGINLLLLFTPKLSKPLRRVSQLLLFALGISVLSFAQITTNTTFLWSGDDLQALLVTVAAFTMAAVLWRIAPLKLLLQFLRKTDGSPQETIALFAPVSATEKS